MEDIKQIIKKFTETQPLTNGKTSQPNYDEPIKINKINNEQLAKCGIFAKYENATFEMLKQRGVPADMRENANLLWQYAENFKENAKNGIGLLLKGNVGTGKSTLAVCVMRKAMEQGYKAYFLPMASLVDTLFTLRDKTERWQFEKKVRATPLLVLDDLGAEPHQDFVTSKIDAIITERNNRQLPTIITTNLLTKELQQKYTNRTYDRLKEKCAVLNFKGASLRKNAKIIVKT